MEHKDGDIEDVVNQMLQDRRENPKGRIDRQKYVDKGHPINEVRKAAENVAEIWPILDKYGNVLKSEETIKKLQGSYKSLEEKVREQEKKMKERKEGKKGREELETEVRELKLELERLKKEHEDAKKELQTLPIGTPPPRSVNVSEMESEIEEKREEIDRLRNQVNKGANTIRTLNNQMAEKSGMIEKLRLDKEGLREDFANKESIHREKNLRQRSRYWKILTVETAVLAILVVIIVVSHALNVIAGDIIMIGRPFVASMIYGMRIVTGFVKRFPQVAFHFIELHLTLFFHSLIQFLKAHAVVFLIVILFFLLVSISANKWR